jgi:hypothetical protein
MKLEGVTKCLRCKAPLSKDEILLCYTCEEGGTYDC